MKSIFLYHQAMRCHGLLQMSSSSSRALPPFGGCFNNRMFSGKDAGEALHEIGEKARSTAEEFTRRAQEKKDEIKERAEEALATARDAALYDTKEEKEKFKEKVEKGDYNHVGRD